MNPSKSCSNTLGINCGIFSNKYFDFRHSLISIKMAPGLLSLFPRQNNRDWHETIQELLKPSSTFGKECITGWMISIKYIEAKKRNIFAICCCLSRSIFEMTGIGFVYTLVIKYDVHFLYLLHRKTHFSNVLAVYLNNNMKVWNKNDLFAWSKP